MLKFKLYFLITLSVINVVESNGDNTDMPQNYQISQSYLAVRLDLNSFLKCLIYVRKNF